MLAASAHILMPARGIWHAVRLAGPLHEHDSHLSGKPQDLRQDPGRCAHLWGAMQLVCGSLR